MTLRKQIAAFMSLVFAAGTAGAQDLKSGPYKLPYKNTYVKEVFVAENEFRTAKPEHIKPRTFAEARKILPSPVWEGHEKEVEMYWHAWQTASRRRTRGSCRLTSILPTTAISSCGTLRS